MTDAIIHDSTVAIALVQGADFRFERVNRAYAALTADEPMVGRTLAGAWPAAADVLVPLLRAVRASKSAHHETAIAVEDRYFDFSCVPLAGDRIQVIAVEVTARRRAEQDLVTANRELQRAVGELESALAERTVLFQELHHRVKNNLAVVSSLLRMKADGSASDEVRQALRESQERVHSMSLIHEQLCESGHLDRIPFSDYVRQIVHQLHRAFAGDPDRVAMETDLDPVEIPIEQAVPCGLILNELVTNAFKYAFPDGRRGRVLVSLHETAAGVEIAVEDNGIGLAQITPPECSSSLGLRIAGILAGQLDGVLEQQPRGGARIVLRFALRGRV